MGIEALLSTQIIDTTSVGRAVMTAVDATAARTALGLGTLATQNGTITDYLTTANAATTYQPLDADLTALAALSGTNDIYYRSAANTWSSVTIGSGLSFTGGTLSATGGSGITSLNGLTGATQTFATATTGIDFAITSSGTAHTFAIPDASATARGLITTGTQTIAGRKTFSAGVTVATDQTILMGASSSMQNVGSSYLLIAAVNSLVALNGNYRLRPAFTNNTLDVGHANAAITFGTSAFSDADTNRVIVKSTDGFHVRHTTATTAATAYVYNTFTSATSYERVSLGWSGNVCTLTTENGSGGGTLRGL